MNTTNQDRQYAIATLNQHFLREYPALAAKALEDLPEDEIVAVLSEQPLNVLSLLWPYLLPVTAQTILPKLPPKTISDFLFSLDTPECLQLLSRLEEEKREYCLHLLPEYYQRQLKSILDYPPGSAGRLMDTRILSFHPTDAIVDVASQIRKKKNFSSRQVLIVDNSNQLIGVVDVYKLAISEPETTMEQLLQPVTMMVSPFDQQEEVSSIMKQFNLDMLPVVDVNRKLLGAIRYAALIQVLQEESANDIQTMVGVSREERALSSVWFSVRKRLPWMEINLMTAFLAAAVVGLFESTIAQFTALAVLLPVVAGQSGNAGAQALAVTMRGLALREISLRNWFRVMNKEINVGLLNGIAIAITTALGVYVWSQSFGLALVISIAMVISMVMAGLSGALIPILLSRFGQDPAQSSSIILTTVTDVAGFMSFLGIATLLSSLL